MIKYSKEGELQFVPANKILNEIKYLHKEMPSFCYVWGWEARAVNAFEKDDFIEQVQELKAVGCVKRCEVYARKPIQIGKRTFNVRLVSYGSSNKKKMYIGPNHLAHAFDKLLFDYVFVFLESPMQTAKKIPKLIEKTHDEPRLNYSENEIYIIIKMQKYVPSIKFIGKRVLQAVTPTQATQSTYTHKVVNYRRAPLTEEYIDAVNQGGIANLDYKKVKKLAI